MILIVDDDPSVTASLSLLLKQAGVRRSGGCPTRPSMSLKKQPCRLVIQT
jgi:DNA-binding response OmpR family regulator